MKKLTILAVALFVAVATQAASVKWNSGAVYNTAGTDKVGKGATAYTVAVMFFTDSAGTTAATGLSGDMSSSTAGTGSKYSGITEGFAAGKTYYAQMIISTDGYEAKSGFAQFVAAGTGDTSLNFATGEGFSTVLPVLDTSVAGTWKSTAAPEPTSGLLLLLGMAGLALKRKVA